VRKLLVRLKPSFPINKTSTEDDSKTKTVIAQDVCPEKFSSVDLSGGYPFFYKGIYYLLNGQCRSSGNLLRDESLQMVMINRPLVNIIFHSYYVESAQTIYII